MEVPLSLHFLTRLEDIERESLFILLGNVIGETEDPFVHIRRIYSYMKESFIVSEKGKKLPLNEAETDFIWDLTNYLVHRFLGNEITGTNS